MSLGFLCVCVQFVQSLILLEVTWSIYQGLVGGAGKGMDVLYFIGLGGMCSAL